MSILYVGIDLTKNVLAVHGVNALGVAGLRQQKVLRAKLLTLVAAAMRPPQPLTGSADCSASSANATGELRVGEIEFQEGRQRLVASRGLSAVSRRPNRRSITRRPAGTVRKARARLVEICPRALRIPPRQPGRTQALRRC